MSSHGEPAHPGEAANAAPGLIVQGVLPVEGTEVSNAGSVQHPDYAAAMLATADAAEAKKVLEDEEARLMWREETRKAQEEYDKQWLAERMPPDDYLARGAQHVANPSISMFRVVGEPSASQMLGRKLGAPTGSVEPNVELQRIIERTDAAWRRLCDADWMDPVIEQLVEAAPPERKAEVRCELREMQLDLQFVESRPCGVPHLRQFAQALYACKDDLARCHGWDAHIVRGGKACTKVEVTAQLLAMAVVLLVDEGLDDEGYRLMACPSCLQPVDALAADGGAVTWRSLHPCMHWLCHTCTYEWVHVRGNRMCPFRCTQPILFTMPHTRL